MNRLVILAILVCSFCVGSSAVASQECVANAGKRMSSVSGAPFSVHVLFSNGEVPLNVPFDVQIEICSDSGAFPSHIAVDATMPAHKHGMNYKPKVRRITDNQYVVENLLYHMPGVWRLEVTAQGSNQSHRFTSDMKLQ